MTVSYAAAYTETT